MGKQLNILDLIHCVQQLGQGLQLVGRLLGLRLLLERLGEEKGEVSKVHLRLVGVLIGAGGVRLRDHSKMMTK